MAIVGTHLTTASDTTDGALFTTASHTPTTNSLILAWVLSSHASAPESPSSMVGNSVTWVEEEARTQGLYRLTLLRAMGTPSAGTTAMNFATAHTGCSWSIIELSGTDTTGTDGSGAIVQSVAAAAGAGTSLAVTLAAFGSALNATVGGFSHNRNEGKTVRTGFTELGDTSRATPDAGLASEWRVDNDTTVDMSWATSGSCIGIAAEIKAAVLATPSRLSRALHQPQFYNRRKVV